MTLIKTTIFVLLTFFLLNADYAVAQQKGNRKIASSKGTNATVKKTASNVPIQPQYSTQRLDLSVASLPVNYLGHNVVEIYKRLEELQKTSTKGEFETTEAFRQRIATEKSKPLVGSLTRESTFAFVIGGLHSKYNADTQLMSVDKGLSNVDNVIERLKKKKLSLIWDIEGRDSSYIGSNAYGAQVKVEKNVSEFYTLAFANYEQFPISQYITESQQKAADYTKQAYERIGGTPPKEYLTGNDSYGADIKMGVQKAIKAKDKIKMLIVCRLVEPYTLERTNYYKPTINTPRESLFLFHHLNVELIEIWFFDSSTGEIYLKQQAQYQ